MIQRIQTFYMVLLILDNIFIVISIDSNPRSNKMGRGDNSIRKGIKNEN